MVKKKTERKPAEKKKKTSKTAVPEKKKSSTTKETKKVATKVAKPKTPEKKRKKVSPKKKVTKAFVARGKRKECVARASIKEGKGNIRMNSINIMALNNNYIREIIKEPMRYIGPEANVVDISVNVNGGGVMGQAQAARTAIANALIKYFDKLNLREKFMEIDRSLVIEDIRRVEAKKYRGPKARARFQKSYR